MLEYSNFVLCSLQKPSPTVPPHHPPASLPPANLPEFENTDLGIYIGFAVDLTNASAGNHRHPLHLQGDGASPVATADAVVANGVSPLSSPTVSPSRGHKRESLPLASSSGSTSGESTTEGGQGSAERRHSEDDACNYVFMNKVETSGSLSL